METPEDTRELPQWLRVLARVDFVAAVALTVIAPSLLGPRGEVHTADCIGERLAVRNLMEELQPRSTMTWAARRSASRR